MKIWTSPKQGKDYAFKTIFGVSAIVLLILALSAGGAVFLLSAGLSSAWLSLALCLLVTALAAMLSLRLGRSLHRDTLMFFLTPQDRLFAIDISSMLPYPQKVSNFFTSAMDIQKAVQKTAASGRLPPNAGEIIKVISISDRMSYYAVRCIMKYGRRTARQTLIIVEGYENESELLFQLRRRERWNDELLKKRGIPMGILISFLCMCAFIFLCTQSHEAVSRLPKEMYFPCLGLAYISAVCLAIFSIKRKRGE